jgi:hypothetical protein
MFDLYFSFFLYIHQPATQEPRNYRTRSIIALNTIEYRLGPTIFLINGLTAMLRNPNSDAKLGQELDAKMYDLLYGSLAATNDRRTSKQIGYANEDLWKGKYIYSVFNLTFL